MATMPSPPLPPRRRACARRARHGAGAVALLSAALLAAPGIAADDGASLGQPAPALVVQQLDGQTFDLARERGKVVIVNFWATWCSPCRAEMPLLDSFYQRYRARGLVLIGVSVDDAQDRAEVVRVMQRRSYPAALAASAKTNGFGPPLAVPMTWIVDRTGTVRARLLAGNAVTEQSLTQAIVPLLPPAAPK